jgi:FkbM family methyltransferase
MTRLGKLLSRFRGRAFSFLVKADNSLQFPAKYLSRSFRNDILFAHNIARWFQDQGDRRLRLVYPELHQNSIVFDLGGYKGQFAADICERYGCQVFVFEPFGDFYRHLKSRFAQNPRIRAFPFALGRRDEKQRLFYRDDGTSVFGETDTFEQIEVKSFDSFMAENRIECIDLIKINIEGSEYDFLESVVEKGLQTRLTNIQVQFHKDIPDSHRRMTQIKEALLKTHELTYAYEFVWENYRLRQHS